MQKSLIISVDFDGTIVEHKYPEIGEPMPLAFEVMKELIEAGHRLVLNTCREDVGYKINKRYLTDAIKLCKDNGVEFVSHNCNRLEDDYRDNGGRKVYAHVYIDDKNLGGFPGWEFVRSELLKK